MLKSALYRRPFSQGLVAADLLVFCHNVTFQPTEQYAPEYDTKCPSFISPHYNVS